MREEHFQKIEALENAIDQAEETGKRKSDYIDNTLDAIAKKDEALYEYIDKESEGLEPNAKELIKIFTAISQTAQREFQAGDVLDKKTLIEKAIKFKDITAQIFEKLRPYVEVIRADDARKFEHFDNLLLNFAEQSEAIQKDAESLDENDPDVKNKISTLNGAIVSVLYRMRSIAEDLYVENLYDDDNPHHNNLPKEIPKKISITQKEKI